jgi:hypothetical protein
MCTEMEQKSCATLCHDCGTVDVCLPEAALQPDGQETVDDVGCNMSSGIVQLCWQCASSPPKLYVLDWQQAASSWGAFSTSTNLESCRRFCTELF